MTMPSKDEANQMTSKKFREQIEKAYDLPIGTVQIVWPEVPGRQKIKNFRDEAKEWECDFHPSSDSED